MSTRSMIALKTGDQTCLAAYCHSNGDPAHHGPILLAAYDTEEKVRALLALGQLSVLGPELGEKHDFRDDSHPDWCTAYGRDRGERNVAAKRYAIDALACGVDYAYLFDSDQNSWLVTKGGRIFVPLADHPDVPKPAAVSQSA